MFIKGRYHKDDMMATLISENMSMLLIMSCFGIPFGVASRSIDEVCSENGVQSASFLAVVNLLLRRGDRRYVPSLEGVEIDDILRYLHNSHLYYLDNRLPEVRVKLESALSEGKISKLILRNFDDYVESMRDHIVKEEAEVFPYIQGLKSAKDKLKDKPSSMTLEAVTAHDYVNESLAEFKSLIIRYYSGGDNMALVSVILDLFGIAQDIAVHACIEERLLAPLISEIEIKGEM